MRILALVVLAGCSWTGIRGSGNAKTEVRTVPAFSAIDLTGSVDAEIAAGPEAHVEISGDDNIVPLVTTDVHGDRLEIGTRQSIRPNVKLLARITLPRLTAIDLTGSGDITARGLQADHLAIGLGGSGNIRADGTAHDLEIDVRGSGDIAFGQLAAERARVSVSGSGDVDVSAARALDVSISGSGDVTYHGDPELKKHVSGSGSVVKK
ncbi:MAG TPA: head GIN domain-containing protein [Kofleriaceae bacterium]|jgi:hypothetical protein|nr:head GIN domain-containing protein [Kofleriaceae bacterium]